MQYCAYYQSPIGQIQIIAEDDAVTSLTFADSASTDISVSHPVLMQCTRWLDSYFARKQPDPAQIPVRLNGTAFQQKVWEILKEIPYGQSITYREIAKRISSNMSAQAVGGAVGSNPVSIIIPCHRVLDKDGKLTGYAYGIERKKTLLDLESIPYCK